MGADPASGAGDTDMNRTDFAPAANAADALTIHAFDRFRDAAHGAGLPLPAINAFAEFKSAVDFAFLSLEAAHKGDVAEAEKLALWVDAKLADMDAELAKLVAGAAE